MGCFGKLGNDTVEEEEDDRNNQNPGGQSDIMLTKIQPPVV